MKYMRKDLLGLRELTFEEIDYILSTAELMKYILLQDVKKTPHLNGKSIVSIFYENSTRTKLSFDLAAKYLSATSCSISVSSSSVNKGETLIDTGKTVDAMAADVVIIRHPFSGAPHIMAKNVEASVINAGDGVNEHPTQALLDMFTIKEEKGTLNGIKVAVVGDILHSRVARSNIWGLTKMGAQVRVAAPATFLPPDIEDMGVSVYYDTDSAIKDVDVVMGLRIQRERQKEGFIGSAYEYYRYYGINQDRLKLCKKDALVMHPGPVNRAVEIDSKVLSSENSMVDQQVTNGVAVRMALLYLLTRKGSRKDVIN
ncbi:MAG: aspartate carbamoyltransferase catalytic subunit [Clostridia bacterium]|nr:aspartate carbamoyltransferase catalytic subunit [Clostridia bacterium]